jgi:LVIVD repeat
MLPSNFLKAIIFRIHKTIKSMQKFILFSNIRIKPQILIYIGMVFIFISCKDKNRYSEGIVMGYKPIYIAYDQIKNVRALAPKGLKNPGKIYIKGKYLYINEIGEGIHIYDNSDKTKPVQISFLSIPANQDISIKNNILYADNGNDLLAIDIADPLEIKVLKRIEKAFPYPSFPFERGSFECANPDKGFIIKWEYTELENPKCYR